MTGGRVVVLGPTGRNFAAGMSGGIAYIWDPRRSFPEQCNPDMVALEHLEDDKDLELVEHLVSNHARYTDSAVAKRVLDAWPKVVTEFVKVMPIDYKRVLEEGKQRASAVAAG